MNNEAIQRTSDVIFDSVILENDPIHIAGAAVLLQNQSEGDAVFSVFESANGVDYTLTTFSTPTTTGEVMLTMVGLSSAVVLFRSDAKYVRLQVRVRVAEGVRFHLVQFEPRDQQHSLPYA